MTYNFYDTCALLSYYDDIFNKDSHILISNITLKELEQIKTSYTKDEDTKYKARKIIRLLNDNFDKVKIINYKRKWDKELKDILLDNNDSRIILCAKHVKYKPLIFITTDLSCKQLASSIGLNVQYKIEQDNKYKGYITIDNQSEDFNKIYENINYIPKNLLINEYLFIKTSEDSIDKFKLTTNGLERLSYPIFNSKLFGKTKPRDEYQFAAMDSLLSNVITVLRGPAGSGKSYLAMSFLFDKLEKGEIDKIIIFCNTVAAAGSAKLGFYPGSRDEKLLDSQIGNFLVSKLGDRTIVEKLMADGKLILLPLCDIRGYDTTNMRAGIYITEAQNFNIDLMKLALQRIGEDCICILDGDDCAQVDMNIYAGYNNGLKKVSEVFRGENIYGEVSLVNIYRSRIAELAEKMK